MSYFQDWLSKTFKPCVLVLSSDKAKEILAENNLTPAEFLRPLGDFRQKKLQIQFNEKDKEPTSLNDFILDFYDAEQFTQIKQEQVINYIEDMFIQNEPSWNLNYPLVTKNNLESVKSNIVPGQYCTPWFREFEKTILECLNFDEYELYQQPLIHLFIVDINESIAVINDDLGKKCPKLITSKRYDQSNETIIITLNDCKNKNTPKEEIAKSKSRFAIFKNYHIIHWDINCAPFADKDEREQKTISENYKNYIHKIDIYNTSNNKYRNYKEKQYGKYINVMQYNKYREDFLHYFSEIFLPKLVDKIINPYYDKIKKNTGISNFFKKNVKNYYHYTNIYRFSELERAYYNLGIIYFYFHNYDLANDNLKLLRNALKDKSDQHKDRVKELKGICKFLQKKVAKKEFNYLEEIKLIGNPHQLIRVELIIIKMLESKLYPGYKGEMNDIYKMIDHFLKFNKIKYGKENKEIIIEYFNTLLEEKLAVYNLTEEKFRKYVFYMAIAGKMFSDLDKKNYALYCLSKFLYFIDNPSPSFQKLRMHYNSVLGEICNSVKYNEGSFKFYKNCFEFSSLNFDTSSDKQNKYLQYYVSITTQVKDKKIVNNIIDLSDLNIPQVDNASLFILEKDDYDIKERSEKIENSSEKNWLVFNKYAESLTTDVYASLDEVDLNHIKLIHDLTNETDKKITNVHTDRFFQGNINQKLFVKCAIRNPLGIDIQISSLKLYCTFIPKKGGSKGSNVQTPSTNNNKIEVKDIKDKNEVINEVKEKGSNNNIEIQDKEKDNKENNNKINVENKNENKDAINENKEDKKQEEEKEKQIINENKEKENNNENNKIEENKVEEKLEEDKEIIKKEKDNNLIKEEKDNTINTQNKEEVKKEGIEKEGEDNKNEKIDEKKEEDNKIEKKNKEEKIELEGKKDQEKEKNKGKEEKEIKEEKEKTEVKEENEIKKEIEKDIIKVENDAKVEMEEQKEEKKEIKDEKKEEEKEVQDEIINNKNDVKDKDEKNITKNDKESNELNIEDKNITENNVSKKDEEQIKEESKDKDYNNDIKKEEKNEDKEPNVNENEKIIMPDNNQDKKVEDIKNEPEFENKEEIKEKIEEDNESKNKDENIEKNEVNNVEENKAEIKNEAKDDNKEEKNEEITLENKDEIKEEKKVENKEEIKEEDKEENKKEVIEESKEGNKEEIKQANFEGNNKEIREEEKENAKEEIIVENKEKIKDEAKENTQEEIKEENKEEIKNEIKIEIKEETKVDNTEKIEEGKKEEKQNEIKEETKSENQTVNKIDNKKDINEETKLENSEENKEKIKEESLNKIEDKNAEEIKEEVKEENQKEFEKETKDDENVEGKGEIQDKKIENEEKQVNSGNEDKDKQENLNKENHQQNEENVDTKKVETEKIGDNKNNDEQFLNDFEIITKENIEKKEEIMEEKPKDETNEENINNENKKEEQKDEIKNEIIKYEQKYESNKKIEKEDINNNKDINNNNAQEQNKETSEIAETKSETPKGDINEMNINSSKEKENKDSNIISRPSLEYNFKIDSHTESNQNDENHNESTKNQYPSTGEETPNPNNEPISSDNPNIQNVLSYSVVDKILKPGETVELELNVCASQEGKIIVKGLEFSFFSQCNIIHLFSKKTTPSLYYYRGRKKYFTMGGASHISSSSSSDYESRNSSELVAKNLIINNIIIPRKNKIEYIVVDYKNDLYVSFPLGTKVNTFLYELFFFPILIKNNSPKHRVRRYTVFIEESDKTKIKSFNNFITRDKKINPRGSQDMIFVPIVPMATGKAYLKILIKFISDLRQSPIQVKRFLIKLKIKDSISFEVKEYCSNLKEDKDGETYNKIDFNIKTNLRIRNEKEIKNLKIKEPFFSKDLILINQKNYLINNNEIHKKYVFDKENNFSKNPTNNTNNENKYDFTFMQKIINSDNPTENKEHDISYIINKFTKILNNSNSNAIFFPWEATYIKKEGKKGDPNNENEKEVTLYGLYPYKLKMKNSETTKTFLSFLFNKFTNLKISTKKIDKEKTLIKMILKLDKIGLASMGDKFEKYEIVSNCTQKSIIWLGPKFFSVKNNLEENTFTCRFNYITTLKGNIEVNRIAVLVYKKPEKNMEQPNVIKINHITKPTSIFIE